MPVSKVLRIHAYIGKGARPRLCGWKSLDGRRVTRGRLAWCI
jgi:hypothetical protein